MRINLDLYAGGSSDFPEGAESAIAAKIEECAREYGMLFIKSNANESRAAMELAPDGKEVFDKWLAEEFGEWAPEHFDAVAIYSINCAGENLRWVSV